MAIDELYLRNKINEEYEKVMSILQMSNEIDVGNSTNLIKANQGVAHLCGLEKVYAYLQLYNENFDNPKWVKIEAEMKKTLDEMKELIVKRVAKLLNLESRTR